jgi:hypothetical protein
MITRNTYTGNGTTKDFTFTFTYIFKSHIYVTVNGTATTAFTFFAASTIRFNTAPPNGASIVIYRSTPSEYLLADFTPGSAIREQDLETDLQQVLNVAQELQTYIDLQATAGLQAQITAVAATANSASTASASAVATANSALAITNATQAYTAVSSVSSLPTNPTVGQKVEVYDTTGIESLGSVTGKPTGFSGSSNLIARLVYTAANTWKWLSFSPTDPDKRYFSQKSVFEFSGVVGDGVNDDTVGLQSAFDWVQGGSATQGPYRKLVSPAGYSFRTTAPLTLSKPCHIQILSFINYNSSTGTAAVVVGATAPVAGRNKGYDLHFAGLRHVNDGSALGGWGSSPTAEYPNGVNGIEFRAAQMSRFRVDEIQAFRGAAVFMNCPGAAVLGYNAHFQQNNLVIGEVGYCSFGIRSRSKDAALCAAQANHITVQSLNGNFKNLKFDEAGGVYNNTTSNLVHVNAAEAPAPGGINCEIFGSYNRLYYGFLDGSIYIQDQDATGLSGGGAFYNVVETGNSVSSGVTVFMNANPGNNNYVKCAPPSPTTLPTTQSITPSTVYRNTTGRAVALGYTANLQAGASSSIYVGPSSTPVLLGKQSNDGPNSADHYLFAIVPPWHYWQVVNTGTVTLTTARLYDPAC